MRCPALPRLHPACAVALPLLLGVAGAFGPSPTAPPPPVTAPAPAPVPDRAPADVAIAGDGRIALTANRGANTASLVDLETGRIIAEVPTGPQPFAVALSAGGDRAIVTNYDGNSVTLLEVGGAKGLTPLATLPVGDGPRGVALSPDGAHAFVALSGEASVAVVDLVARRVVARWPVGAEPWHLALSDGRLVVGCSRARVVDILDAQTGKQVARVPVLCRNLRHLAVAPGGAWAYLPGIAERGMAVNRASIDRGWVVGNRLVRVPLTGGNNAPPPARETLTLDKRGDATADLDGAAFSPGGRYLALTAAGTHELILLLAADLPFIAYGGSGDYVDTALAADPARYRRIALGGRPLSARWIPNGKSVVVANDGLNALQIVDSRSGQITRTIPLGGPAAPTLARQGEAIFTDARRSFGAWYSCNTCHAEGHSNGGSYDTLNDGGYGKPKKTPSLRGVALTAPYTWHGWQATLPGAVRESLEKSMQGPTPTAHDALAVTAYLETLRFRPSPNSNLSPAAVRGQKVFAAKACANCHGGPNFASPVVVNAGLEEADDVYPGYNPPTLRGIYDRAPFLHDGRAATLEDVLTHWHRPSALTGQPDCTPAELADLVAYLRSL